MKNSTNSVFKNLIQVGMVVSNLNISMKKYAYDYGLGPMYVLELNQDNVQNMYLYGKKKNYSMNLGVCNIGDVRFELIEPISKSIYSDYLNKYNEGIIHHLKLGVDDYFKAIDFFKSNGIKVIQHGEQSGDGGKNIYTYLDTSNSLGFIIEVVQVTSDFIKPKPDYWFPLNKKILPISVFRKVFRIGIVVKNLDKKIKEYKNLFGLDSMVAKDFNFKNISDMHIYGRKKNYEIKAGFFMLGNVQIVLIEPLSESIYSDFLKRYGEGVVHHLGMEVEDYDKALIFFKSKGIEVIQSGNYSNKLRYSYLSTSSDLSYIVEIAETNRFTDFFP